MKRLFIILGVLLLVFEGLMIPVVAQNEGEVTVTADLAQVSISVNPSAVSYGTVEIGATGIVPVQPVQNPIISAKNEGSCWVDFKIKGADTTNWALASSQGSDTYVHYWGCPPSDPTFTPLDKDAYQDMFHHVSYAPGSSEAFKLMMDTPTSSTYFQTQQTTVTVMAIMVAKGISATLQTDEDSYPQWTPSAILTVTVLDENDNPLTGLTSDYFHTMLKFESQPSYGVTVTFTETEPGIYNGSLDIASLGLGTYHVSTKVIDTSDRVARGMYDFEITP